MSGFQSVHTCWTFRVAKMRWVWFSNFTLGVWDSLLVVELRFKISVSSSGIEVPILGLGFKVNV